MKKLITIAALILLPVLAQATQWSTCVQYWYNENVSTNVPPTSEIVSMTKDYQGLHIQWLIEEPPGGYPPKAELAALEPDAVGWREDRTKDKDANIDDWTEREKAFALVLRDNDEMWRKMFRVLAQDIPSVSNCLTAAGFTPADFAEKSVQEWKDAIKAKM